MYTDPTGVLRFERQVANTHRHHRQKLIKTKRPYALVNILEDILEEAVVAFQDGVLRAEVERPLLL